MGTKQIIKNLSEPINILIYLGFAFLLGLVIAITYKKTHKGLSYSQSFVSSLIVLLPIGTLIFQFISNNVAMAIGVFGAFSVVRFRTAVKESKDMIYIFWILATSLVIGAGHFGGALTSTTIIATIIFFLYYIDFGNISDHDYLLIYNLNTDMGKDTKTTETLKRLTSSQEIVNIKSLKNKQNLEVSINIKMKRNISIDNLVKKLNKIKGIENVNAIPSKQNIEY